jgi:hypothetical protein
VRRNSRCAEKVGWSGTRGLKPIQKHGRDGHATWHGRLTRGSRIRSWRLGARTSGVRDQESATATGHSHFSIAPSLPLSVSPTQPLSPLRSSLGRESYQPAGRFQEPESASRLRSISGV